MKTLATIIREAAPHTAKPAGADLLRREDVVAFIHKLRDLYEEEFALDEYSTAWGQCAAALEQGAVRAARAIRRRRCHNAWDRSAAASPRRVVPAAPPRSAARRRGTW